MKRGEKGIREELSKIKNRELKDMRKKERGDAAVPYSGPDRAKGGAARKALLSGRGPPRGNHAGKARRQRKHSRLTNAPASKSN